MEILKRALALLAVVALLASVVFLAAGCDDGFADRCHARGGHVKTVTHKYSTEYCITPHGVVDVE